MNKKLQMKYKYRVYIICYLITFINFFYYFDKYKKLSLKTINIIFFKIVY